MRVAVITEVVAKELQGKEFAKDSYFNPIQDIDNNFVISEQEIEQITNDEYMLLKELELIEFTPKKTTI